MTKKELIRFALFSTICIAVGYIFFNTTVGNGVLVGLVFGLFHYAILRQFYTLILSAQSFKVGLFALYFIGNLGIFAVPLYIGCVYPSFVNVFGAAFGLTIHNLFIYGDSLLQRIIYRKER